MATYTAVKICRTTKEFYNILDACNRLNYTWSSKTPMTPSSFTATLCLRRLPVMLVFNAKEKTVEYTHDISAAPLLNVDPNYV